MKKWEAKRASQRSGGSYSGRSFRTSSGSSRSSFSGGGGRSGGGSSGSW